MLRPIDHLRISKLVREASQREVSVHIPTYTDCTECGFDEHTRSARDPTCSVCEGKGRTVSWLESRAWVRIGYPRAPAHEFAVIATNIKGDLLLGTDEANQSLFEGARDEEDAYVLVGERRARVHEIHPAAVEQVSGIVVACEFVRA